MPFGENKARSKTSEVSVVKFQASGSQVQPLCFREQGSDCPCLGDKVE